KPPDGSGGASVFANITNEPALIDAINYIKEKQQFTEVIVQQHDMGDEIRVYVLDGKVLAAANRLPVTVLGDVKQTVAQLIKEQTEIAVNASKAIPGLVHSGVDIIINPVTNQTVVLEVNTRPGIGSHLFPIEGEAVDIPKALIDFYFPETKNQTKALPEAY